MNKCIGCGVLLQNDNKEGLGYTPKLDNDYCERCFKTIHYGTSKKISDLDNDLIIEKINTLNYFTFFITDIINLNQSIIDVFNKILTPKILVVNKIDLLPKNLKLSHLLDNIKTTYSLTDVLLISGKKGSNLNTVANLIEEHKNVLFCGETSSGKSTLINNLLDVNLTTSKYDNTTLEFIKIDNDQYTIYDTPGLNLSNKDFYNQIKIITKTLKKEYTLYLNDVILKFDNDENLTLLLKDNVNVKQRKEEFESEIQYRIKSKSDIVIDNIGFIYIKDKSAFKTNNSVEIRKSIVGGK